MISHVRNGGACVWVGAADETVSAGFLPCLSELVSPPVPVCLCRKAVPDTPKSPPLVLPGEVAPGPDDDDEAAAAAAAAAWAAVFFKPFLYSAGKSPKHDSEALGSRCASFFLLRDVGWF